MANHHALITWALAHRKSLGLKITRYRWPSRLLLDCHDFSTSFCLNDELFVGRGTDTDESIALAKSISEALERFVAYQQKLTSTNGVAAHPDQSTCVQNAVFELLERDSFLCHFLTRTPFLPEQRSQNLLAPYSDLISELNHTGIETGLRRLRIASPAIEGFLFFVNGNRYKNPFGIIMGAGCSQSASSAVRAAVFQVSRNVAAYMDKGSIQGTSVAEGLPDIHSNRGLSLEYGDFFSRQYLSDEYYRTEPLTDGTDHSINVTTLFPSDIMPSGCPLYFARAHSSTLQGLYWGANNIQNANLERLSQFSGCTISAEDIQTIMHPFG